MNSKWYVALVSACVAAITLSACNQNGAAESQPLEQSATSGHPNSSTSSSVGEASKPDWLVGGWIPAGSDCDSGEGISIDKDYTWSAEGVGGKWSLEGETIKLDETYSFDDNGNKVRSSGAPPMFIEYKGDNEFQFKGGSSLWNRCPEVVDGSSMARSGEEPFVNYNSSLYDGKNFCAITTRKTFSLHDNTQGNRSSGVRAGTVLKIDFCDKELGTCYTDGEVYMAEALKRSSCR